MWEMAESFFFQPLRCGGIGGKILARVRENFLEWELVGIHSDSALHTTVIADPYANVVLDKTALPHLVQVCLRVERLLAGGSSVRS